MKTIQEIASVLIERRSRATPIILPGEMIAAIEPEGMQEALQRRWVVPDMDSGNLMVTTDLSKLREMQEAASTPPVETKVAESACAGYAVDHANRPHLWLHEIAAPATGKPGPALTAPPPVSPTAPTVGRATPTLDPTGEYDAAAKQDPSGKTTLKFTAKGAPPSASDPSFKVDKLDLAP